MEKYLTIIITVTITSVLGIIFAIVKNYFDGFKEDNKATRAYVDEKIKELTKKQDDLSAKYTNVFNELLEKFSKWEDRIKKVMDDYIKEAQSIQKIANENVIPFKEKDVISQLDTAMKKEIKSIFKDITSVENDVKRLGQTVNLIDSKEKKNEEVINSLRTILFKISTDISSLRVSVEKNQEITEDKLAKMYQVCKTLNSEYQKLVKRIDLIQEMSRTKISLKD